MFKFPATVLAVVAYAQIAFGATLIDELIDCVTTQNQHGAICLKTMIDSTIPRFKTGFPEFDLAPLDPFKIDKLDMQVQEDKLYDLAIIVKKATVAGLAAVKVDSLTISPERQVCLTLALPSLVVEGNYNAKGNVLGLPIDGVGPFKINADQITGNLSFTYGMDPTTENLVLDNYILKATVQSGKVNFDNLNGNNDVGKQLNTAMTNSFPRIYQVLSPKINAAVAKVVAERINTLLMKAPKDVVQKLMATNP